MFGDVVFFENWMGRIIYCGIILLDLEIIYVFGSVCIDKIDYYGIYDWVVKCYIYWLRVVCCMLKIEVMFR